MGYDFSSEILIPTCNIVFRRSRASALLSTVHVRTCTLTKHKRRLHPLQFQSQKTSNPALSLSSSFLTSFAKTLFSNSCHLKALLSTSSSIQSTINDYHYHLPPPVNNSKNRLFLPFFPTTALLSALITTTTTAPLPFSIRKTSHPTPQLCIHYNIMQAFDSGDPPSQTGDMTEPVQQRLPPSFRNLPPRDSSAAAGRMGRRRDPNGVVLFRIAKEEKSQEMGDATIWIFRNLAE